MDVRATRWQRAALAGSLMAAMLLGCSGKKGGGAAPGVSSSPAVSTPPAVTSSAPVASSAPARAAPVGGVATWEPVETRKDCTLRGREIDVNLAYGSFTLTPRGKDLALVRFLRSGTRGEAQITIAGYDGQTRSIAPSHGLGRGLYRPARLYSRGGDWVVFWFDAQGMVFTRTGWAANANTVGRFPAVPLGEADRFAMNTTTPDGPLLGVSPLAPEPGSQLGVFLFQPGEKTAEIVKAVGVTHEARRPKFPAVSPLGDGYVVAWVDELAEGQPASVVVTRLDSNGREPGAQLTLSTPGRAASAPALVVDGDTVTVAWSERAGETDEIVVQTLDNKAWQLSPARRVDRGTNPVLLPVKGSGAALGFLRQGAEAPHAAVVLVDGAGQPASRGLLVSEDKAKNVVKETPAIALTDDGWLSVGFTYNDGNRAQLRSVRSECLGARPSGSASPSGSVPPADSAAPRAPAAPLDRRGCTLAGERLWPHPSFSGPVSNAPGSKAKSPSLLSK